MRRPAGFSREASDQYRFMVPSWAEVRKLFAIAVADLDEHLRDISVDGEKTLKPAHLVNSVLTWYLSRPRSEQIEIARQGRKGTEWLRTQSEIPDFQRFDMDVISQEWERLKNGSGKDAEASPADRTHHAIASSKIDEHSAVRSREVNKKPSQPKRRLRA